VIVNQKPENEALTAQLLQVSGVDQEETGKETGKDWPESKESQAKVMLTQERKTVHVKYY
jgi:hypothetical protein